MHYSIKLFLVVAYLCVRLCKSLKRSLQTPSLLNTAQAHCLYRLKPNGGRSSLRLEWMLVENSAPDRMMSSLSWEGRCDRFGSRWGVIGTIKEEKQKRWSSDKLYKQADGKKNHRWDREGPDKHWKMVLLERKTWKSRRWAYTFLLHPNPIFLQYCWVILYLC